MPPDDRVKVGVCAWVEKDHKLLMIRRGGLGEYAIDGFGTWSLPGGWLDYGETPEEAAVRECLEETSVVVGGPIHRMGFVNCPHSTLEIQIVTLLLECTYRYGNPNIVEPDKCPEVEWVPKIEVVNRPLFAPLATWLGRPFE